MQQRSKYLQLARLLGELGELLPYVPSASREFPAPGWYAKCEVNGGAGELWRFKGMVYLGADTPAAAVTIAKIHG